MSIRGFLGDVVPVYMLTMHAYGTWSEGHRTGYVQRDEGLKPSSPALAKWRDDNAKHGPAEFTPDLQRIIVDVAIAIAVERRVRLHAASATLTHTHQLVSFRSPACTCGASKACWRHCQRREFAEAVIVRVKRKRGRAIARHGGMCGRPWFSRGWDVTPVRSRGHFDDLVAEYFPKHATRKHATREHGTVRVFE